MLKKHWNVPRFFSPEIRDFRETGDMHIQAGGAVFEQLQIRENPFVSANKHFDDSFSSDIRLCYYFEYIWKVLLVQSNHTPHKTLVTLGSPRILDEFEEIWDFPKVTSVMRGGWVDWARSTFQICSKS